MFGGGGSVRNQPLQSASKPEDKAAQLAVAEANRRKQQGKGYASTVLTSWMSESQKGTTFGS